jgi:hypothetical protein
MEKIARFLPLGLFCVFSVKLMMQDYQDFSDAATLLVMGGLSAFFIHKKSEEFQHLESKLKLLESAAEKDAQEVARLKKEVEDTKGLIGGIKLGQQLKTQMNRN